MFIAGQQAVYGGLPCQDATPDARFARLCTVYLVMFTFGMAALASQTRDFTTMYASHGTCRRDYIPKAP